MKGTTLLKLGMVAFIVLVIVAKMQMPRSFRWAPTYSTRDGQPFGCLVFDSVMKQTVKQGYSVSKLKLEELLADSAARSEKRGYLILSDNYRIDSTELNKIRTLTKRGNIVMIATDLWYCDTLMHYLDIETDWASNFNIGFIKQRHIFNTANYTDTLIWKADNKRKVTRRYRVFSKLISRTIYPSTAKRKFYRRRHFLAYTFDSDGKQKYMAVTDHWGRGKIIVSSTPLFFTNYGILDSTICQYNCRMMDEFEGLPIVRLHAYATDTDELVAERSPLRYFIAHPPLRWALNLTLLGVLLFMTFGARRRQKAIPVVEPPANRQLEFVQLIGTLYHQRHDNLDLVRKKQLFFNEEVRRRTGIDLDNEAEAEQNIALLAERCALPTNELKTMIEQLNRGLNSEQALNDRAMKQLIDNMNKIIQAL